MTVSLEVTVLSGQKHISQSWLSNSSHFCLQSPMPSKLLGMQQSQSTVFPSLFLNTEPSPLRMRFRSINTPEWPGSPLFFFFSFSFSSQGKLCGSDFRRQNSCLCLRDHDMGYLFFEIREQVLFKLQPVFSLERTDIFLKNKLSIQLNSTTGKYCSYPFGKICSILLLQSPIINSNKPQHTVKLSSPLSVHY